MRVYAFLYGLTDVYPPFGFGENTISVQSYPVQVAFDLPASSKRVWAIPLVGLLVKEIILIPHLLILYVLGLVVGVLQLVLWVPVLFTGKYPDFGYSMVGGYLRWSARVGAFLLGLNDQYPPFQMGA